MKAWAFGFGTILGGVMLLAGCGSPGNDTFGVLDAGHDDVTLKDAGSLRMGGGNSVSCSGLTCARLGYTCGITGDGCGGMLDCGTCVGPETCGGGGKFSVCGGSGPCTPKTCSDLGATCGPQGDGCGNLLQCGLCTAPDICGGGGTPSTCGGNGAPHPDGGLDGGPCVPITCASLGFSCGPAGDGCGNVIQCGSCTNPGDTCGGGGTNGQCGQQPTCTPATCGSLGFNCGPAGDGCGGVLQCGSCSGSDICGGGGQPGVCGDAVPCTNLCPAQKICGSTNTTTLTGTVVAGTLPTYVPSGQSPDPIPNVIVYVPNGTPAAFTPGIECQACGADVTGDPLIETTTDYKGNFTLTNVPVPSSGVIPLVIQLGRWRRIFGLGNALNPGVKVTQCVANNVGQVRMPRTQQEGDIPFTAISTGEIDAMECVLLKMGVDKSEFTDPGVGGRIEIYQGNGAVVDGNTPQEIARTGRGERDEHTRSDHQVLFPRRAEDPHQRRRQPEDGEPAAERRRTRTAAVACSRPTSATRGSSSPARSRSTPRQRGSATRTAAPVPTSSTTPAPRTSSRGRARHATFYKWMNALAWGGATSGAFGIVQERKELQRGLRRHRLWIKGTNAAPPVTDPATGTHVFAQLSARLHVRHTGFDLGQPPRCSAARSSTAIST